MNIHKLEKTNFTFLIRLRELKKKDEEKVQLAAAKNDVESFIIDYQDKLYQVYFYIETK